MDTEKHMTPIPRYVTLIREGKFRDACQAIIISPSTAQLYDFVDCASDAMRAIAAGPCDCQQANTSALLSALIACALDLAGYPHEADGPKEGT